MPTFESRNRHRRITAALGALGALALVVACAPETEPDPEPTGFATEEEALEAARETYEGYVEATNGVDSQDPTTFEAVYDWLTDDELTEARQVFSEAHADGISRTGNSVSTLAELQQIDLDENHFTLDVCLDVSDVRVFDDEGNSLVDPERSDVQAIRVSLVGSQSTRTGLAIALSNGREDGPSCDG